MSVYHGEKEAIRSNSPSVHQLAEALGVTPAQLRGAATWIEP